MNPRSYLYVPADNADRLLKSSTRGADALIVDLEDGVALANKQLARTNARVWLEDLDTQMQIWVRINEESIEEDLESIVHPKVTGIVLAKSSTATYVRNVGKSLTNHETKAGISNPLSIIPLIESAEGVLNSLEIAKGNRVTRLMLGEQDLTADLSLPRVSDNQALDYAHNTVIYSSAAALLAPPIAPVSVNFKDLAKFEESTLAFLQRGCFGRSCIHPDQIGIVNRIFMPSEDDIEWAKDVLTRFENANGGATADAKGNMIDEAVAKRARRLL